LVSGIDAAAWPQKHEGSRAARHPAKGTSEADAGQLCPRGKPNPGKTRLTELAKHDEARASLPGSSLAKGCTEIPTERTPRFDLRHP
jgi:hypothetical protein